MVAKGRRMTGIWLYIHIRKPAEKHTGEILPLGYLSVFCKPLRHVTKQGIT